MIAEAKGLNFIETHLKSLSTIVTKKPFCKKMPKVSKAKKLVLVLTTSVLATGVSKEA